MSINRYQQKLLLDNIAVIKPNFHCFTVTFHVQLKHPALTMRCPDSNAIRENSYLLYCALERTLSHLENLPMVIPFIQHHANNMASLGVNSSDIDLLCDAFYNTLEIHLGKRFTSASQAAWTKALQLFKNIVKSYLFNFSNVVSIDARAQKQQSS